MGADLVVRAAARRRKAAGPVQPKAPCGAEGSPAGGFRNSSVNHGRPALSKDFLGPV